MFSNKVFTLTFGCQSENHIGMQKKWNNIRKWILI